MGVSNAEADFSFCALCFIFPEVAFKNNPLCRLQVDSKSTTSRVDSNALVFTVFMKKCFESILRCLINYYIKNRGLGQIVCEFHYSQLITSSRPQAARVDSTPRKIAHEFLLWSTLGVQFQNHCLKSQLFWGPLGREPARGVFTQIYPRLLSAMHPNMCVAKG
jgi:hypothetical protein